MIKAVIIEIDGQEHRVPFSKALELAVEIRKLKNPPKKRSVSEQEREVAGEILGSLWELSPKKTRSRTSKKQVWDAWRSLPVSQKPSQDEVIDAYEKWLGSEEWAKDNGQFIPGLHRWIKNRQWENIPTPAKKTFNYSGPLGG